MTLDDLIERAQPIVADTPGVTARRIILGDVERYLLENEAIVPYRYLRINDVSDMADGTWNYALRFGTYGPQDTEWIEGGGMGGIEAMLEIIRKWILRGDPYDTIDELINPTRD